jgi:hypothetical protein
MSRDTRSGLLRFRVKDSSEGAVDILQMGTSIHFPPLLSTSKIKTLD